MGFFVFRKFYRYLIISYLVLLGNGGTLVLAQTQPFQIYTSDPSVCYDGTNFKPDTGTCPVGYTHFGKPYAGPPCDPYTTSASLNKPINCVTYRNTACAGDPIIAPYPNYYKRIDSTNFTTCNTNIVGEQPPLCSNGAVSTYTDQYTCGFVCDPPLVFDVASNTCIGAVPTGCSIPVAPANGSLSCNWTPGLENWSCNISGGCTNTVGFPKIASNTVTTAAAGTACSSTDPHVVSSVTSSCFTERTNIDTPSGPRKIKDLKIGEAVYSYDPNLNQISTGIITQVFYHKHQPYRILNADSNHSLEVTPNHPIYDSLQKSYLPVSELNLETQLLTKKDNLLGQAQIVGIDDFGLVDDVYNIEVEPDHNYFANGVLVHNKLMGPGPAVQISKTVDTLTSCTVTCNPGYTLDVASNTLDVASNTCIGAVPPVGSLIVLPPTKDYGKIVINSTDTVTAQAMQDFTFTNTSATGSASSCTIGINGPYQADFVIISSTCTPSVASRGSCQVKVQGVPRWIFGTGTKNATLDLTCSGSVAAQATLVETAVNWPIFALNPPLYKFSPTSTPIKVVVTITNVSTSLSASNCTVAADLSTASNFNISSTNPLGCNFTPLGTCSFNIGPSSTVSTPLVADISTTLTFKCTSTNSAIAETNYSGANFTNFAAPALIGGPYTISSTPSDCPPGYSNFGTTSCKPIAPSTEYSTDLNGYPVCGPYRLPVSYSDYSISSAASNLTPHYSGTVNYNSVVYSYATSASSGLPSYIYGNSNHCICSSKNTYSLSPPNDGSAPQSINNLFLSDDYDTVSKLTSSAATPVSEVVFPSVENSNGYPASAFFSCGCPNVNETASALSANPAMSLTGTICKPKITSAYKVLIPYDPATNTSMIIPESQPLKAIKTIYLPTASQTFFTIPVLPAAVPNYKAYSRKIWTCAAPFELDSTGTQCVFISGHHACDDGTISGTPSVVSSNLGVGIPTPPGGTVAQQTFNNAVNKRLACCLNTFDPANPNAFLKYDCVDNSQTTYKDFDDLWQSSTEGVPNAILLTNANGEPITGFYSLNGVRCPNCSEFAGAIQSATVNPYMISSQQNLTLSGSIGGGPNYTPMNPSVDRLQSIIDYTNSITYNQPAWIAQDQKWKAYLQNKIVPNSADLMRTYPILVRAAIRTVCPSAKNSVPPAANTTYPTPAPAPSPIQMIQTYNDGAVTPNSVRCMGASQVTAQLQIKQWTTITGAPNAKTYETNISLTGAPELQVNVKDLINNKVANVCPLGLTYQKPINDIPDCYYP